MVKRRGWDPEDPLEAIEGEMPHQNAALRRYYLMGAGRTLRGLTEQFEKQQKRRDRGDLSVPVVPTTSLSTLSTWSSTYDWVNRSLQQDMLDNAKMEAEWLERRKEVREDDWQHASQLRSLAQRILDAAPAFVKDTRKVVDEGKPRVVDLEGKVISEGRPREIVITVALSVQDLVRVEKMASKLARLAAEMDESRKHVTIDWREEAERAGLEPSEVFQDAVAQFVGRIQSTGGEPADSRGTEGGAASDGDK